MQICVEAREVQRADCLPGDRLQPRVLLNSAWQLLYSNLWLLLALFVLADLSTWVLHRVAHRITNACMPCCRPASADLIPWQQALVSTSNCRAP